MGNILGYCNSAKEKEFEIIVRNSKSNSIQTSIHIVKPLNECNLKKSQSSCYINFPPQINSSNNEIECMIQSVNFDLDKEETPYSLKILNTLEKNVKEQWETQRRKSEASMSNDQLEIKADCKIKISEEFEGHKNINDKDVSEEVKDNKLLNINKEEFNKDFVTKINENVNENESENESEGANENNQETHIYNVKKIALELVQNRKINSIIRHDSCKLKETNVQQVKANEFDVFYSPIENNRFNKTNENSKTQEPLISCSDSIPKYDNDSPSSEIIIEKDKATNIHSLHHLNIREKAIYENDEDLEKVKNHLKSKKRRLKQYKEELEMDMGYCPESELLNERK